MEVGGWGGWKDLGGGETITRICCIKNTFSIKMNEKRTRSPQNLQGALVAVPCRVLGHRCGVNTEDG